MLGAAGIQRYGRRHEAATKAHHVADDLLASAEVIAAEVAEKA